jgi:chromosome segregation protein
MRLAYVEMIGFRCFRSRTRIDLPHGFLVIVGRNGTGKSTLIDAVEYALTGTIGKYRAETGGKESIQDYLWWRGIGEAEGHSVKVGFLLEDGTTVELERSRDKGPSFSDTTIAELLCVAGFLDSAVNVCRSSIIRDELIAALSWDQTDTARFEFVRSALGARPPVEAGTTLPDALQMAAKSFADIERETQVAGARLRASLGDLSEATALARSAADLHEAVTALQAIIRADVTEISQLMAAGRRYIVERRMALQAARAIEADLVIANELREQLRDPQYADRSREIAERVTNLRATHDAAVRYVTAFEERAAVEQEQSAEAASFASLLENGERLGLRDGKCPLCGLSQDEAHYRTSLQTLRQRLTEISASLLRARSDLANKRREEEGLRSALGAAQREYQEVTETQEKLQEAETRALTAWRRAMGAGAPLPDTGDVERQVRDEEYQLSRLETHVFVLEASQAVDRIARLEQTIATARAELEKLNARAGKLKAAVSDLREAERAIKRANGEVVDERLASISPLLSELYYRLRPHRDWRTIDYRIRGDVRRFLSLRVGDDLNPQFMFSSGERRAAGLAFLLAVSLSRPWCRWQTLILDDPVQHVDDFRALHLVEVLSAIRRDSRQIICAVEDSELGELMCRRLRSTIESPGARLDLEFNGDVGSHIQKWSPISPLPEATVLAS